MPEIAELHFTLERRGNKWWALHRDLPIAVPGDSIDKATKNLLKATAMYNDALGRTF